MTQNKWSRCTPDAQRITKNRHELEGIWGATAVVRNRCGRRVWSFADTMDELQWQAAIAATAQYDVRGIATDKIEFERIDNDSRGMVSICCHSWWRHNILNISKHLLCLSGDMCDEQRFFANPEQITTNHTFVLRCLFSWFVNCHFYLHPSKFPHCHKIKYLVYLVQVTNLAEKWMKSL